MTPASWKPTAILGAACAVAAGLALTTPVSALTSVVIAVEILAVVFAPRAAIATLVPALIVQEAIARNIGFFDPGLPGVVRSLDEILMLATVVRLGVLAARRDMAWFDVTLWRWPAVFLAAGLASSILHWRGLEVAVLGMALASKFFVYLLLASSISWKVADIDRLIRWCIPLAGVVLAAGLIGFLVPSVYERYFASIEGDISYERGGLSPFALPFVNPGLYGWTMAVLFLASLTLTVERRSRAGLLGMLLSILGVLASLRRRPLIGIPLAVASALSHLGRRQIVTLVVAAVAALGVATYYGRDLIDVVVQDTVANYLDPLARDRTARAALTAGGISLAVQHFPLGAGFGTYGGFVSQRNFSPLYDELGLSTIYGLSPERPDYIQDTYWPHVLGETGVAGAIAMLVFIVGVWRRASRIRNTSASTQVRMLAMFGALILVEGAVESIAGPVFEYSLQALVIAIPIGMVFRLTRDETLEQAATPTEID